MELASTQALLARLYTDAEFREEFARDPESAAAEYGIEPEQARSLTQQCTRVGGFARSLLAKRLNEARPLLPMTAKLLGDGPFDALFLTYARGCAPRGINKPREDAIGFARSLQLESTICKPAREAARFEGCRLEAFAPERRFRIGIFRLWDLDDREQSCRFVFAVWLRLSPQSGLVHYAIRLSWLFEGPGTRTIPGKE